MPSVIQMDDRLIEAMQAGDESALSAVIDKYTAYVGTIVWNIVAGRLSEDDAKEILSDVFFTLWKNREKFRGGNLKSYLGRIARSKAIDALRKSKQNISLDDLIGVGIAGPEEDITRAEEHEALQRALDSLPEPDYMIFVRYYYWFQKTSVIAEKMGLNVNTVQAKLRRGREAMRKVLVEGGYFNE